MSEPLVIDTRMHGHEGLTAAYLVRAEATALVETGPMTSLEHVLAGLSEAGVERLDRIVVTHVHLDHAGAAGALARRYPEATVAVHEVGAPHLVDPAKLIASATRIYGESMERLWGGIEPVPEERVVALSDGDKIELGGRSLQAVNTPGHAWHHHAFVDDLTGIAFVGDALGVRLPDVGVLRPATPPPELDVEAAIASVERMRQIRPSALWLTHYGPADRGLGALDVDEACDRAVDAYRRWEGWVIEARTRTGELDAATALVERSARAELEGPLEPAQVERLEQTTSYRMNTSGYMRYLDRKERVNRGTS